VAATDDILFALAQEVAWAREGPQPPVGEPRVVWHVVDDWQWINSMAFTQPQTTAIRIDGETDIVIADQLDRLTGHGYIQARNPRYLFVRTVDPTTKIRMSIAILRRDSAPSETELQSIPYLLPAVEDAIRTESHSALAVSSISPRAPHRDETN